jgi:GNAT superfamily N-acetyltransferase
MDWVNRMAELVEDWNFLYHRDGARATLSAILTDLARLPYRRLNFLVFARSLLEPLPDFQPKIPIDIRPFEAGDLKFVRELVLPSEAKLFEARLANNHTGLIGLSQGRPVGYAWGSPKIDPAIERFHTSLEEGDVLCVDAFTVPAFRGKGVQTALTLARCSLFCDLGYRRAIAYIEKHNHPSSSVWQKIGAQQIGEIVFERIGPWRRSFYVR